MSGTVEERDLDRLTAFSYKTAVKRTFMGRELVSPGVMKREIRNFRGLTMPGGPGEGRFGELEVEEKKMCTARHSV